MPSLLSSVIYRIGQIKRSSQEDSAPQQEPKKRTKYSNKVKPVASLNFYDKQKTGFYNYKKALAEAIAYLQLNLQKSKEDVHNQGYGLTDLSKYIDALLKHPYLDYPGLKRIKHFMDHRLVTNTRDFIKMYDILTILESFQEDLEKEFYIYEGQITPLALD